ncbi:MAG: FecR family protein [Bdellovibrionota bacterium]|nr:FecR family protein [Bdellovibrionota bacterium]
MKYLIFFIFSLSLFAQEFAFDKESQSVIPRYLGKVILLKGQAHHKGDQILKVNDKIYPYETLTTEKGSLIKLEMVDMSILTLGPKSSLTFEKWKYKTKSDREALLNLNVGKMRAHFKIKAKKDNAIKIKASHVSMGVRGTEVMVNHLIERDDSKDQTKHITHFATLTGSTHIYDRAKDYEIDQEAKEHYISILDHRNKVIRSEAHNLDPNEWEKLRAKDKNPRKYFKPLLDTNEFLKVTKETTSSDLLLKRLEESKKRAKSKTSKGPSWKKTLKQLNQRLNQEEL